MVEKYTIGIDIGTTGVKASVLDVDKGMVVAHSLKEHPLFHPKPGYAEQEGNNYWKAVVDAIKDCFQQGSYGDKISGVSLSGLVGVMLPIDKEGNPVRPGMIWMDSRSEEECTDIRNTVGEETINKIDFFFTNCISYICTFFFRPGVHPYHTWSNWIPFLVYGKHYSN